MPVRGTPLEQTLRRIGFDNGGEILVSGYTQGSVDLGGGSLVSAGGDDIFVGKLDETGTHVWSKLFGDALNQTPEGLALGTGGVVILGGVFEGTLNFGGTGLVSAGGDDLFLAAVGP